MEFRLYDKVNCSVFDLIGKHEPHQTKSLGLLLAKSEKSLKTFLKLIDLSSICYDEYIVDCEPRNVCGKRFDILIRFYKNRQPLKAVLIEAKGVNVTNASSHAIVQIQNYYNFYQLNNFINQVRVTLTRDIKLSKQNNIITITWSQLIAEFYKLRKQDEMVNDFISFIMSIQGNMNYYEEDILAIPAGSSIKAVIRSGLYECPVVGRRYASQRKTLYLAFKKKAGEMDKLYKLKGIIEGVDLNDSSQIQVIDNMSEFQGLANRINDYKKGLPYSNTDHNLKRVFVLDMENSISLPNKVRPLENNANWPYYKLNEFLQPANSNINQVILQNNVTIAGNELCVKTNGRKMYELYESHTSNKLCTTFLNDSTYTLNPSKLYKVRVIGVNRSGKICDIKITNTNGIWNMFFEF